MHIDSFHSRLTSEEQGVRDEIMDHLIAQHQPLDVNTFAGDEPRKRDIISSLHKKKVIVINKKGLISFSYPVSGIPSKHKVMLSDGRWLYAMCAIDALGCAFAFSQDIEVASACEYCKAPVKIKIENGEICHLHPPEVHALHVDLNKYSNWAATC